MDRLRRYCLVLNGLLWACPLHAAVLDVPATVERLTLGVALDYFLDEAGTLDPAAAMNDRHYRPAGRDSLTFGFRSAVLWLRLSLRNPGTGPLERILHIEPGRLERADLFVPMPGGWRRLDNGIRVAAAQRPIPGRGLAFPVRLDAGETRHLYLRVQSRTALSVLPVLWEPAAFRAAMHREDMIGMLSLGALLGMAVYAIVLFPLRRDRATLRNGLALACYGLGEMAYHGYGAVYVWPDQPDWELRAVPVCFALAQLAFNRFIKAFLPLRALGWRSARYWLDALFLVEAVLVTALLLGAPWMVVVRILVLMMPILPVVLLSLTVAAIRQGYGPARWLATGLLMMTGVMVLRIGEVQGWLPVSPFSARTGTAACLFTANLLFFAAISQRVDRLQREKDIAQAEALNIQRQAAARLERLVAERTRELHAAKDRAEQANRAKGDFLARVSHELRTPLHTILGYTHLLRREVAAAPGGEWLGSLAEGGRHLARLIDDLLDYARGERGAFPLVPEAVFFYRCLERWREQGTVLTAERNNHWEVRFDAGLPAVVRMDARRLEQVVLILLSNAARYTRAGRIVLTVAATAIEAGRVRLRIEVADTGQGIANADLVRIFEPFEQAGSGQAGGLGLGLAIGRQIVRAMGGELRVESRPGEGSRFWFEIELDPAAEDDIPMPLPDLDILGYAGPARDVLIVEDHAANRHFLAHLLSELGFRVHAADGVQAGLALAASVPLDLVLLDQRLPDGTAWELLRRLRETAATAAVPAVLLSALPPTPPDDWDDMRGFDVVLLKPAGAAELLSCIGGLLELTWLREVTDGGRDGGGSKGVLAPADAAWETGPLSAELSAAERTELAELARQGAVYEIEEWIARLRLARPQCRPLLARVEERLAALDFAGITAVVGN